MMNDEVLASTAAARASTPPPSRTWSLGVRDLGFRVDEFEVWGSGVLG